MTSDNSKTEEKDLVCLEYNPEGNEVILHADAEGLRRLERTFANLAKAAEAGEYEHDHMFGPGWGGWELVDKAPEANSDAAFKVVDHLKVYAWPKGFESTDTS